MVLKTRKPTGAAPPPIVLVTGEQDTGKSTVAAKFTGSPRVGRCFWMQIGKDERTADRYGRVKGANYEIVEHDGTWRSIMEAARDVAAEADKEYRATGKIPVIAVDSMNGEWRILSRVAEWKARNSKKSRAILQRDPHADIPIGSTYWNGATRQHEDLLDTLADSAAIIVLICRSNLVTEFDKDGQPMAGTKTWSIQGQKNLLGYVDIAVQLHRTEDPELLKLKAVEDGIIPGKDASYRLDGRTFSLDWLIFDRYGLDPGNMARRDIAPADADHIMPGEDAEPEEAPVRRERPASQRGERVPQQRAAAAAKAAEVKRWFDQLNVAGPDRIVLARELIRRWIDSPSDLSGPETDQLIKELKAFADLDEPGLVIAETLANTRVTEDTR